MKYLSIPNILVSAIFLSLLMFYYSFQLKNLNTLTCNSKGREVSLLCSKLSRQITRNLLLSRSESSMKMIRKESSTFKENKPFSRHSHSASTSCKLTNHSISQRRKNPKTQKCISSKKWSSAMKI